MLCMIIKQTNKLENGGTFTIHLTVIWIVDVSGFSFYEFIYYE